eukprot:CAMPEP_0178458228 /NCGR_PEP_ID=MMETSP0689_2-20121128/47439_1 /TAXON_ID=160604 /ORGANISM="Amphidinium massartii, Strain CS-259" /LENGTH=444 /DNA_ID=CAMNT_0020084533 /DNA_START=188 /DNA_END=1523 /DNA_ORIENTATION=-
MWGGGGGGMAGVGGKGMGGGPPPSGPPVSLPPGVPPIPDNMDWECSVCREKNFAKKPDCFKCKTFRTAECRTMPARVMSAPPCDGTTVTGMVKSYNKKGFGFLMCFGGYNQDVYFTRENVSSKLLHPDMPGEQVSFEVHRERGKLVARNVRTLGESLHGQQQYGFGKYGGKGNLIGGSSGSGVPAEDEDKSWICPSCGSHNFSRRSECFKCKMPRPLNPPPAPRGFSDAPQPVYPGMPMAGVRPGFGMPGMPGQMPPQAPAAPGAAPGVAPPQPQIQAPKRTFSPHAGARAIRESLMGEKKEEKDEEESKSSRSRSRSSSRRSRRKGKKRKGRHSSSSSSSSSSDKKRKKKKGKKRSKSSSSSEEQQDGNGNIKASGNPAVDKAKQEALQKLLALREIQSKETRMSEWRALLRQWHPDKNLDNVEVATAVFQFLQKGKSLMNAD